MIFVQVIAPSQNSISINTDISIIGSRGAPYVAKCIHSGGGPRGVNAAASSEYPSGLGSMGCGAGSLFFNSTPPLFENKYIAQKITKYCVQNGLALGYSRKYIDIHLSYIQDGYGVAVMIPSTRIMHMYDT